MIVWSSNEACSQIMQTYVFFSCVAKGIVDSMIKTKSPRPRSPLRSLIKRDKLVSQKPVPKLGNLSKSWKKWLGRSNIEYQTQRIKFGFGRTDRTKLFEEFGRLNGRLRELLDTSDQSTALKQSREQMKNSMIAKAVCRVWRHATSLHELLEQAWCCQCKHMHRVHLLLRHETNLERIEYSVCLMYTVNMFPSSPWNCVEVTAQRMEIKTLDVPQLEEPRSGSSTSISSQPVSKSASKDSQPSPKPALRSPRTSQLSSRRKVNWTDSSVASAAISTDQKSSTPVIKNLCSSIAACEDKNTCLGMLKGDEESYLLQHDQRREDMQDSISLESLLQGKSDMRLDRRQRYTIAFMLVSSHLQLYPSPWLSSQWTKKDILFVKDADNPGSVKVEQPYMRRDAVSVPRSTTSSYASRDRLLPTLGILLIELCFGTALENHEMRKHCQSVASAGGTSPDLLAALDLGIALEWSRLVGGEAGERYADAVQWCLKGQVPVAKDDKWREELYANVVLPVRFCYEQFRPQAMQT